MCGIAGIFSFNSKVDPQLISKMTDLIHYRGPDDFGYLGYNTSNSSIQPYKNANELSGNFNLYFGHRRLSILDLSSAGHQPMSFSDRYWITYNGEVYNYLEIRKELISKGYTFITNTDTEVILAAYQEWGVECQSKFNGMWSFAILDRVENTLFVSRDRFGIKPLYYSVVNNTLIFSSEIKQIISTGLVPFTQNDEVVGNFFFYVRYNPIGESTFFKGIKNLPGGCYFKIDLNNHSELRLKVKRYWSIDTNKKVILKSDSEYADKYYELFRSAVDLCLRSDVAVGSALSGGLDSSGIVCTVADLLRQKGVNGMQKTFTSVSDVAKFDETDYAKIVSGYVNAEAHYILPNEEMLFNDHEKLIWHNEEPFISTSIFAGWCVNKLTKQNNVTVSLDGQGPDEMMGGYSPFDSVLLDNLLSRDFNQFRTNFNEYQKNLGVSSKYIWRKILAVNLSRKIPHWLLPSSKGQKSIFKQDVWNKRISRHLNNDILDTGTHSPFEKYSLNATFGYPLPGILRQVDRNSMAFSVETRVPFLDYRLVEYTFSLPLDQKVRNGVSKFVYRNALQRLLPKEIFDRKTKLGFVTAEPEWLKGKKIQELFRSVYSESDSDSLIDSNIILKQFDEFVNGKRPFSTRYWTVFNYLIWLKKFKRN